MGEAVRVMKGDNVVAHYKTAEDAVIKDGVLFVATGKCMDIWASGEWTFVQIGDFDD